METNLFTSFASQLAQNATSTLKVAAHPAAPWTQDLMTFSQQHATSAPGQRIAFVDAGLPDYQTLVSAVAPGTQVKLLDPTQNAIAQITDYLANQNNIASIDIISHGEAGALDFSSMKLDLGDLADYSMALQSWATALTADADISLYGCDIAANDPGKAFVQALSQLTGADVAASTDLTGNAALGANWNLEFATGSIESAFAFEFNALSSYSSTLDNILNESFTGSDVSQFNWIYNTTSGTRPYLTARSEVAASPNGLPGGGSDTPGNGALRLTSDSESQSSFVIYDQPINNASGLSISFDLYSYGGDGADGISFFLIDGSAKPTSAGASGGSLGYAYSPTNQSGGLVGGYIGIGFDEYGNFSNPGYGSEGAGFSPDAVVIRGSQASGYKYLTGVTAPSSIDNPGSSATRENSRRHVRIDITPTGLVSVKMDLNNNNVFDENENLITDFNVTAAGANNAPLPATFKFGFSASTGGSTNIHEINNYVTDTYNNAPYIPLVRFAETTGTLAENGNLTLTAQLDRATTSNVTIPLTLSGTADGSDYTIATSITIAAGNTTGTVLLTGTDDALYEQAEDVIVTMGTPTNAQLNPDSTVFTATITDNDPPNSTAPTLTVAGTVKYLERTPAITVAPALAIGSAAPSDTLNGATVTITSGLNLGDRLSLQNTTSGTASGITWNYDSATGVLTLSGSASVATYQALLQQVAYNNTTTTPNSINRTVAYSLQYGSNQSVNGSSSVTLMLDGDHGNSYYGDFNGDGKGDLLWRNQVTGQNGIWLMNGATSLLQKYIDTVADTNWHIEEVGDFNGDRKADILWRNQLSGQNAIWLMNGTTATLQRSIDTVADTNWQIREVGDFNGDGKTDITWRHQVNGRNAIWLMNGTTALLQRSIDTVADTNWQIEEVGDFNGDGKADILWRNCLTGQNAIWLMNGTTATLQRSIDTVADTNWRITAVADFNGDGKADILWRNYSTGRSAIWQMNGVTAQAQQYLASTVADLNWRVTDVMDFNGDGKADLFWRNYSSGRNGIWLMNGATEVLQQYVDTVADVNWQLYRG